MQVWAIRAGHSLFAEAMSIYREWEPSAGAIPCTACGHIDSVEPPALIEWMDGSATIGDFVRAVPGILIRETVCDDLMNRFRGINKRQISYYDHPALYRPKRVTKRTRQRVWLPYDGPTLCEPVFSTIVPIHSSSSVEIARRCNVCGYTEYKNFEGLEIVNSRERKARTPGKGLFFKNCDLHGCDFFRAKYTGFRLCTSTVKDYIEEKEYTNVQFLEVGDILPD